MAAFIHKEFENLKVKDVRETGKELGRGSYGVVNEALWRGTPCVTKRLHKVLIRDGGKAVSRFCSRMSYVEQFATSKHCTAIRRLLRSGNQTSRSGFGANDDQFKGLLGEYEEGRSGIERQSSDPAPGRRRYIW